MRIRSMIFGELYRSCCNIKFLLIIPSITFICFLSSFQDISLVYMHQVDGISIDYIFKIMLGYEKFKTIIIILVSLLSVRSFCEDWKHGYILFLTNRICIKEYAWAKIIANVFSTTLTVCLGMIMYVLILRFKIPFSISLGSSIEMEQQLGAYSVFLTSAFPILYFLITAFIFGLSLAFLTTIGLVASSCFPNPFVAVTLPFLAYFILCSLTVDAPIYLHFLSLMTAVKFNSFLTLVSFIYNTGVFLLLIYLLGVFFCHVIERRISCESKWYIHSNM